MKRIKLFLLILIAMNAFGARPEVEKAKMEADGEIRRLLEPVFMKYCSEDCKLLSIDILLDISVPDDLAPGFDEYADSAQGDIVISSARVKVLIDEKIGPVTRGRILSLAREFLSALKYPVKVDTNLVRFPQPVGSASKINRLRTKITQEFKDIMNDLFQRFCPDQCMLTEFKLETEVVNPEEAQYGDPGEYYEDSGTALRISSIGATILADTTLTPEERQNVLNIAKLKVNKFKNTSIKLKVLNFPQPRFDENGNYIGGKGGKEGLSSEELNRDSTTNANSSTKDQYTQQSKENQTKNSNTQSENSAKNERKDSYERYEKIERVENGDEVQRSLRKFMIGVAVFGAAVLFLLGLLLLLHFASKDGKPTNLKGVMEFLRGDKGEGTTALPNVGTDEEIAKRTAMRYEISRLKSDLMNIFANFPRVAKIVFSRILTEEGIEETAAYIYIFGESIVMDMLRDPSLHTDLNELMEFYAKNPFEIEDEEVLELLKKLYNRTVVAKMVVLGQGSTGHFDFLAEMDGTQIMELIRTESMTVKAIVLTQADNQKRNKIFKLLDEATKEKLLSELSRIDYLPKEYISNVADALKRKRRENPMLNTEALPGSDVLVALMEGADIETQKNVVTRLEQANPEGARHVKSKLVSIETLTHLKDGQLLEVVLSLKHDELLSFLKGAEPHLARSILNKCPTELVEELDEELDLFPLPSQDAYQLVERRILNRMKRMSHEGLINLVDTNEKMFSNEPNTSGFADTMPAAAETEEQPGDNVVQVKKVAGW